VLKLLVGILKGAVIGGALGYGADQIGLGSTGWLVCGLIGAVVGLFVGKPIWSILRDKDATLWATLLKTAFGFGIGIGLYELDVHFVPHWVISGHDVTHWIISLGAAIGGVYGGFVELDDAIGDKPAAKPAPKKQLTGKS
jgi:hypothetical protein